MSNPDPRHEFKRNEGFVFATDMGHRTMDFAVRDIELTEIDSCNESAANILRGESQSTLGLYVVSQGLRHRLESKLDYRDIAKLVQRTNNEAKRSQFNFAEGLGDVGFTWHFAPLVAHEIVRSFQEDEMITEEERHNMTLGDWADIIGSQWFSDVMHDLALTRNGLYSSLGAHPENYPEGRLKQALRGVSGRLFEPGYTHDTETDTTYLTARVSNRFRRFLRSEMHKTSFEAGCPVARHAGTLAVERLDKDDKRRLTSLVNDARLEVIEADEAKIRFRQEYTPIDRALDALALQLDSYDERYGTPTQLTNTGTLQHTRKPKTNVLIKPGRVVARHSQG